MLCYAQMDDFSGKIAVIVLALASTACNLTAPPPQSIQIPDKTARQIISERLSAVVVTDRRELGSWATQKFAIKNAPKDADGGSAAPISADGYFLTADHVLAMSHGKNVFIIYADGGRISTHRARIVWRSAADDLALLHISRKTPYYYQWTPPDLRLYPGHSVIHGGLATGAESSPGTLRTGLAPEGFLTRNRTFKMDIPLEPGDSGGPVIDAYGNLIGINSAVEFLVPLETAIFIDSEGVRPNIQKIEEIIRKDRNARL
jgi:S1-C subfamily serine protease